MGQKHLELFKMDNVFFIQINSMVGRISLFTDHPKYKFKEAINLKNNTYKTTGDLSLVALRKKDLYILEDMDSTGHKAQNFIFVADELSRTMKINSAFSWFKEHLIDFLTRSISVSFLILYIAYYFLFMRYLNTMDTLYVLRYITGVLTLCFAVAYYYLRSTKTKSSFLRFFFVTELFIFIITGTISNIYHLVSLSNATDIF